MIVNPKMQYTNSKLNLKDKIKQDNCNAQNNNHEFLRLIVPRTNRLNSFRGFFLSKSTSQIWFNTKVDDVSKAIIKNP